MGTHLGAAATRASGARRVLVGLAAGAAMVLSGCASPDDDPGAPTAPTPTGTIATDWRVDLPEGLSGPQEGPAAVARGEVAGELVVVTWGSGSCPALPTSAAWAPAAGDPEATLRIEVSPDVWQVEGEELACTEDYGPTASVIEVPDLPAEAFDVEVVAEPGSRGAEQVQDVTVTLPAA